MKKHKYSEIFTSIQGEGRYTGHPTIWLRWFLCNLQCNGFGQTDPANEATWELPWKTFDVSDIKRIEDLPVWNKGCDSSYSWAKKYKHLCPSGTAIEIADALEAQLRNNYNPFGLFSSERRGSFINYHFCMTGGEPMMPATQVAQMEVLTELAARENLPRNITIETNGTQPISDDLARMVSSYVATGGEWFWSVSPKLLLTSGEERSRAIKPAIVGDYQNISRTGQLKFVVANNQKAWDEVEEVIDLFRDSYVQWPVWIMPVGATVESQASKDTQEIVEETIRRGYNVAARVHCYIWGNKIGT
jgi:7-carboxy-7-deazaguanine synthase